MKLYSNYQRRGRDEIIGAVKTPYEQAFEELNSKQLEAVKTIEGPVLVIAGPGTGKTQLIGTRVGYILKGGEVEPSNILLLTFTENGVQEMRERLEKLVPQHAPKIYISTYHGFGNDLIRANPEYFEGLEGDAIDELASITLIRSLIDDLPYSSPLKSGDFYLKDIAGFISDAKRALLTPDDIAAVAKANLKFITAANKALRSQLDELIRISLKSVPVFEKMLKLVNGGEGRGDSTTLPKAVRPLADYFKESLQAALAEVGETGKTPPLTNWKKQWLARDAEANQIIDGKKATKKLEAAAELYKNYQASLAKNRLYDYDDMILRVIEALEANPEFKYTLAEHWQYIMLDEFQDTNPAQMRLVELLTDHPVHEGRPNVLAVGDDDQAIFAFQGADHANMVRFAKTYRDVKLIPLKENYRSHAPLVQLGHNVAGQIETRLHHSFPGIEKNLVAAHEGFAHPPKITATELKTDAAEYNWVAAEIERLVEKGMARKDIAVVSPKHKYLKALMPYLARRNLPVSYEKRENIWDNPQVMMLSQMARLVLALSTRNYKLADALWGEVISYDYWQIPTETIWPISWAVKAEERSGRDNWTNQLLKNKSTTHIAKFFLRLSALQNLATLEEMLDGLIGLGDANELLKLPIKSPFYEFYFGGKNAKQQPQAFVQMLDDLSLLRSHLRERQRRQTRATRLVSFVAYADECLAADINILNTSPYNENKNAVNLLTAYGAKGREFEAVFVLGTQSEVWGRASRSKNRAVKLPANLEYISYRGKSDDERLRLFYVALTRAKTHLYLTSHHRTLAGKYQKHLEFLGITEDENGGLSSSVLPEGYAAVGSDKSEVLPAEAAEDYWGARHLPPHNISLNDLLTPKLKTFRLSATALNHFIDIESYGPNYFFIHDLLGFPQAPSSTSAFGTAVHETLSYIGKQMTKTGKVPPLKTTTAYFNRQLEGGWLNDTEKQKLKVRGEAALAQWLHDISQTLGANDKYEQSFGSEGVVVGSARLSGKIDRLLIDSKSRQLDVLDVKTGKAYTRWESLTKLHKFQQQLMFYKLLVDGSSSYKGYGVGKGIIEFFEPDENKIVSLPFEYNPKALDEFKKLIGAVWVLIQNLDFPDTSKYPRTLAGIKQFERDLISG